MHLPNPITPTVCILTVSKVKPGPNIDAHSQFWNTQFDHNHLRITRIIRCLRVLGLEDEAKAFYSTMSRAGTVSSRSRMYWKRAVERQLNIAPHIDDSRADPENERLGVAWLFEYEKGRIKPSEADVGEGAVGVQATGGDAGEDKPKNDDTRVDIPTEGKIEKVDQESPTHNAAPTELQTNGSIEAIGDEVKKHQGANDDKEQ